ncbi:Dehydrogenase family protein [Elusimicrobium minutum Pei191]|uniref:Dehydrogenase family protein n=1 Tax=Elusimicrobium minutum (strain Pei191) TaxID=445932 RepID=B2KBW5_ELUMP|nr:SDR family NAD(P)-dependent oxidoreductase [Elusimicrobium minutum]ACC97869.1 Dehydrogenase family protein [Elusimicrobium minutum Pei191]
MERSKNILIIGATSGIGREVALQYLSLGAKVAVTGRRQELLASLKQTAPERVFTFVNDVTQTKASELIKEIHNQMGDIDTILVCSGMGDINLKLENDIELNTARTNVLGFTDWIIEGYKYFEERFERTGKGARLSAVSSIASFSGSDAAPAYFASKAYISNYLEGLRKKSVKIKKPVYVTTIIPGFVDTALAKGVGGKGLFWVASAEKAAKQILNALDKRKKIVYVTKRWRFIAFILKVIPDFVYNRFY